MVSKSTLKRFKAQIEKKGSKRAVGDRVEFVVNRIERCDLHGDRFPFELVGEALELMEKAKVSDNVTTDAMAVLTHAAVDQIGRWAGQRMSAAEYGSLLERACRPMRHDRRSMERQQTKR